ncbi:MAG TPA: hypothetical protein VID27_14510 [Blastocatellia bacterium]|jgi:beta-xylosidase
MWSIGIYAGESPFHLAPHPKAENPVLTSRDVTDADAGFVADPFMIRVGADWFMFFEVMNRQTRKGDIGLAVSRDAISWRYCQRVLIEPFHLSYPYVFEHDGEFFMIPETIERRAISLYRAARFPFEWTLEATLINGVAADPSIFRLNGKWWMFACDTPRQHDHLSLYFADELTGPWREHPRSPLIRGDERIARPAGRVIVSNGSAIRFAQDCSSTYGAAVRAFDVEVINEEIYVERENHFSPILKPSGAGWNRDRMHHVDPTLAAEGQWIACVDGCSLAE